MILELKVPKYHQLIQIITLIKIFLFGLELRANKLHILKSNESDKEQRLYFDEIPHMSYDQRKTNLKRHL